MNMSVYVIWNMSKRFPTSAAINRAVVTMVSTGHAKIWKTHSPCGCGSAVSEKSWSDQFLKPNKKSIGDQNPFVLDRDISRNKKVTNIYQSWWKKTIGKSQITLRKSQSINNFLTTCSCLANTWLLWSSWMCLTNIFPKYRKFTHRHFKIHRFVDISSQSFFTCIYIYTHTYGARHRRGYIYTQPAVWMVYDGTS